MGVESNEVQIEQQQEAVQQQKMISPQVPPGCNVSVEFEVFGHVQGASGRRGSRATTIQLDFLANYMLAHPEFASGRFLVANGKLANNSQWERLAGQLNDLPGPDKTGAEWKKCWTDFKCNVRGRAAKLKAGLTLTGNTAVPSSLSEIDLKVLSSIGLESSIGLQVQEMGLGSRPEDEVNPCQVIGAEETIVFNDDGEMEEVVITSEDYLIPATPSPLHETNVTNISTSEIRNETPSPPPTHCSSSDSAVPQIHQVQNQQPINLSQHRKKKNLADSLSEAVMELRNSQEMSAKALQDIGVGVNQLAAISMRQADIQERFVATFEKFTEALVKHLSK